MKKRNQHLPPTLRELPLDFQPTNILEIGVGTPARVRTRAFWGKCAITMVEPHPKYAAKLVEETAPYEDIQVLPWAIAPEHGEVVLYDYGLGSYTDAVPKKQRSAFPFRGKFTVPGITLDEIDHGDFDVALIDAERSEWWALKYMVSRPRFLSLEIYAANRPEIRHVYEAEIRKWLADNEYKEVAQVGHDGLFVRAT